MKPSLKFLALVTDSQVFLDLDEKDMKQINALFREVDQLFVITVMSVIVITAIKK